MTDSNLKSGSWAWPHNGANGPVKPQEGPAATPVASSPQIASSEPEIGKLGASDGQSSPSTPARDSWGRPLAPVGTAQAPVSAGVSAEITTTKQRGRPFQPGQSGNPAGRPKGARSKFSSKFITAFMAHFAKNGEQALNRLLQENPAEYVRFARSLVVQDEVLPEFNSQEDALEFLKEQYQIRDIEIGLAVISGEAE